MNTIFNKAAKTLAIFVALASFTVTFAQQQLIHQPKVFVSKSGNVFWNKKLPVYLKLSTSPDDTAKTYWIRSKITPKYADPFYFDSEGPNMMRTKWAVDRKTGKTIEPKIEVEWAIFNDSKSPSTQIKFPGSKSFEKSFKLFFGSNLKIVMSSQDELCGVENIYYSLNGSEYSAYQDTISLTEAGDYAIKYYAADKVGNVEKPKVLNVAIDNESPTTELINIGVWNENVASSNAAIKLKAEDNKAGVRNIIYALDNGREQIYKGVINTNLLDEGTHTFSYFGIDNIGNREEKQDFEFYVDKRAPLITIEAVGDRYKVNGKEFSSGRTKIKLTAIDNKAGVKEIWYSVNASKYKLYDKPFYLDGKGGNRSIKFYAIDNVNNKTLSSDGSGQNFGTPYLDLTGPKLNYSYSGPIYNSRDTLFASPKTKIVLAGTDEESGLQKITYKINGGEEIEYTSPFSIAEGGYYEITQTGYDNVNNSNRKEFSLVVDAAGPAHFPRFSVPPFSQKTDENGTVDIYPVQAELYLAATDDKVGSHKIAYSINGSAEKLYTSPIVGFEKGGAYSIDVVAYDWLSNKTKSTIKFEILKGK
ncbi:MAG: OmpL47-type beta-barrel domain-containing protein [Cytophagales bacterium]